MKSRITSNVDNKLTPAQRKQAEVDAYNDSIVKEAIEKSKREGPKIEALASDQQIHTTYDRLAETKAFRASTKASLIPLAVRVGPEYPGGFNWVLSDADYDAVLAGAYCGYCLTRHDELWQPACSTCGADRDIVSRYY